MPFKKGVSGNPSGRPKTAVGLRKELDKRYGQSGKKLLNELDALLQSPNEKIRLDALKLAMGYHFGQPTQRLEHSGDGLQVPKEVELVFRQAPNSTNKT